VDYGGQWRKENISDRVSEEKGEGESGNDALMRD
jgi:hypothetical protein